MKNVLIALALLVLSSSARGGVLFFDGFESEAPDVLDSGLSGWNILSGSVDVLGPGNLCGLAGSSSLCVDMDGTALRGPLLMETKNSLDLGAGSYVLSFELAGPWRDFPSTDILPNEGYFGFGSLTLGFFSRDLFDPFSTESASFDLAGSVSGRIFFSHSGPDWVGLLLDDVRLEEVRVSEVPEPGSWILLASGLALLARGIRRSFPRRPLAGVVRSNR